jgi:undecaprenyl-diphosphatase
MHTVAAQISGRIGSILPHLGRTERELIVIAGDHTRRRWRTVAAIAITVAATALAILPHEMEWLAALQRVEPTALKPLAKTLSAWGDVYPGTLSIAASLWLGGRLLNRRRLVRAGIACLLAACLAGLFTDVFRFGLGRARPNSGMADGLYGPSLSSKLHGFPSGHATAALATGVSLAVALPQVAIPTVALGVGVGWSRLYLNCHRPTDVLVGATIGSLFGLAFGSAARSGRK